MDPVVVIGAGPVGLTAALLLARWGLPVVLLERRAARDTAGSRSICQQGDVLHVWTAVGAGAIAEEGLTWTTARTFYRDRELFSWSFTTSGALPPFVNLSQARTEEILGDLAAASGLIDLRWSHEVTELRQDNGGVTLTCANGGRFRASHVIACVGAHGSAVRGALGVRFDGRAFGDEFLICDIRADLPGWETRKGRDPAPAPGVIVPDGPLGRDGCGRSYGTGSPSCGTGTARRSSRAPRGR